MTFINNTALYGPDVASPVAAIEVVGFTSTAVTSGDFFPGFLVKLLDSYNQIVVGAEQFVYLTHEGEADITFNGDIAIETKNGIANFSNIIINCYPGESRMLTLSTSTVDETVLTTSAKVVFRNCTFGEFVNGVICQMCSPGTYLLIPGPH